MPPRLPCRDDYPSSTLRETVDESRRGGWLLFLLFPLEEGKDEDGDGWTRRVNNKGRKIRGGESYR
jgi:hypothetical protein